MLKNTAFTLAIAASLLLTAFTTFHSLQWEIREGAVIQFESNNPTGTFSEIEGEIKFDPDHLEASSFDVAVAVSSINTGNGLKNKHAVGPKWFDAEQFPRITFRSTRIQRLETGFEVTGTLTIKDVSKEVSFPFAFENERFTGQLEVNRLEYGVGTDKGMSANAASDLLVKIDVPVGRAE